MSDYLTNDERLILYLCQCPANVKIPFSATGIFFGQINWEAFMRYVAVNGLASLCYQNIPKLSLTDHFPTRVIATLKQHYYQTLAKNTKLFYNLELIVQRLAVEGIDLVLLKGVALARYIYSDIALRPMSDIDLLIQKEDVNRAGKIFEDLGYGLCNLMQSRFHQDIQNQMTGRINRTDGTLVELHYHVLPQYAGYNIPVSEFWKETQPQNFNGISIKLFSPEYQIIHLCLHLDKHYMEGIRLGWLHDIAQVVQSCNESINWNKLYESCLRFGIVEPVYQNLVLLQQFFNCPIPADFLLNLSKLAKPFDVQARIVRYMRGHEETVKGFGYVHDFWALKGLLNKFRFLFFDIFPSREYMIFRYHIPESKSVAFYYLYRFFGVGYRLLRLTGLVLKRKFLISS